jgi:hypothetical protein
MKTMRATLAAAVAAGSAAYFLYWLLMVPLPIIAVEMVYQGKTIARSLFGTQNSRQGYA